MSKMSDLDISIHEICEQLDECSDELKTLSEDLHEAGYLEYAQFCHLIGIRFYLMSEMHYSKTGVLIFGDDDSRQIHRSVVALSRFRQCFYYFDSAKRLLDDDYESPAFYGQVNSILDILYKVEKNCDELIKMVKEPIEHD